MLFPSTHRDVLSSETKQYDKNAMFDVTFVTNKTDHLELFIDIELQCRCPH